MKKLFIFFFSLIFFFFISNYHITPTYAIDATSATECNQGDANCLGAWAWQVRIIDGHSLTQTVVNQIITILTNNGWFCSGGGTSCIGGAIAQQDTQTILNGHVGDSWTVTLEQTIQQELYNAAQYRSTLGGITTVGLPPTANFTPISPPCVTNSTTKLCSSMNTALKIIHVNPQAFAGDLLTLILSFSGGIIIILIILAGYKLMTSQGDPEKIKEAREQVTSAVIGLLFIVFSFLFYTFITNNILHLPGFYGG